MTTEDDEIEKSSAPLIEHLIELRSRLIWSIGGFFVAFLVCFYFAKPLFNLLVLRSNGRSTGRASPTTRSS